MTWFKFDDNAVDHPKVASLSDRAFRFWVRGMSYANRFLTDGILPKTFWKTVPNGVRTELVTTRLWDWIDPHFLIHDYHHHQARKEDVEYDKARNRQKAADYRARKRIERDGVTGNVTGDALPKVTGNVPNPDTHTHTPTPNKEKEQKQVHRAPRSLEAFEVWWSAYPKKTGKAGALKAWLKISPASETVAQMMSTLAWQKVSPQWTKDGGAYIPNPQTYLNQGRHEDEPFKPTLQAVTQQQKPATLTRFASLGMDREIR